MRLSLRSTLLATLLLIAACQSEPPISDLPFRDDFSNPNSGWQVTETDQLRITYQEGALHFHVIEPDRAAWAVAGKRAADFVLDVDATQVEGPDNNHYGVIVRYADDKNFYRLDIAGDGYYSVQRLRDGAWSVLFNWPESDAIQQGATTNHLRVIADGPKITWVVNGATLAEIEDADILVGDVGLTAGTFPDESGVHIAFDNFEVNPLEQPTP
ncbi:MAG TPA: family 16 glycoside hydrolase [Anaerolineae bacterium]|nr:family 16 glycoside hydrolase [Anaerolineae bacterium]